MVQKKFHIRKAIITGLFLLGTICINGLSAQNVFTVTKITDTDPYGYNNDSASCDPDMYGTLQWAVRKVNDAAGTSTIEFDIPGNAPHIIQLNYTLPIIRNQVTIDGTSQSGYVEYKPSIVIEKSDTSDISYGLYFMWSDYHLQQFCTIKGLHIRKFLNAGIVFYHCDYSLIQDNVITEIEAPTYSYGILFTVYTVHNTIVNNLIGTDSDNNILGCGKGGILISASESGFDEHNYVKSNVIANNGNYGVLVEKSFENKISQNKIIENPKGIKLITGGNYLKSKPVFNAITTLSNVSGTSEPGDSIELFGSSKSQNANEYLATVLTDGNGDWSADLSGANWPYISATATDADSNTSELQTVSSPYLFFCFPDLICAGEEITVVNGSTGWGENPEFLWDYGDNSEPTTDITHTYSEPGDYTVTLSIDESQVSLVIHVTDCTQPCINCIESFAPEPGKKYIISAWVKESSASVTKTSYDKPQIFIDFLRQDSSVNSIGGPYMAEGNIIDGWQKIEEEFEIPDTTVFIKIEMKSDSGNSYFDDIRVFPFDATVKSYVYDPINLRLVSELDERNYATFYEYDEEGKLVRVKKETERGVMTIKESKNSISKKIDN
jgi:hypothetical protein